MVTSHIKGSPSCHCHQSRNVYSIAKRQWGDFLRLHGMFNIKPPSLEPILFPLPEEGTPDLVSTTTPPHSTAGSAGLGHPAQGKNPTTERPSTSTAGIAGLGHPAQGKNPPRENVYSRLGGKRSCGTALSQPVRSSSPVGQLASEEAGAGDPSPPAKRGSTHPSRPRAASPDPSSHVIADVLANIRSWYDGLEYRRQRDQDFDQKEAQIQDDLASTQRRQRRLLEELEDLQRRRAAVRRQETAWLEEMADVEYNCLRHWDEHRRTMGPPPLARAQPGGQAMEFAELARRREGAAISQETVLVRPLGRESSDHPGRM